MEDLALSLLISVVAFKSIKCIKFRPFKLKDFNSLTAFDLTVASKRSFGDFRVDRVVLTGDAGNRLLEHGNVAVAAIEAVTQAVVAVEAAIITTIEASVAVSLKRRFGGGSRVVVVFVIDDVVDGRGGKRRERRGERIGLGDAVIVHGGDGAGVVNGGEIVLTTAARKVTETAASSRTTETASTTVIVAVGSASATVETVGQSAADAKG